MRFAIVNLGCKVNRVESDAIAAALLAAGGSEAAPTDADLIVVNTCTVTGEAEKKTRKAVHRALRANGHARVVVTGCAAAIDAAGFEAMDPRVETAAKGALLEELAGRAVGTHPVLRVGGAFPTRVGIKVQDGCDNACTYCIVHVARGRAWSRDADEVIDEAVAYARAGVREIVLSGINLGSYCWGDLTLAGLLERLLAATADQATSGEPCVRFRISSIEPKDVGDDLVALLASAEGRVCRHLHLPLQSGSSKVLRHMARPYDAGEYCTLVDRLRAAVPELSLSTDVIVGFPGEDEDDFAATLDVVRQCAFSKIHVFPYSRREGTPAADRVDQVRPEIKADRARRLRELAFRLRSADRARRSGTSELVLVETAGKATTESYFEVEAPAGAVPGALVAVALPTPPLAVQVPAK
ncbi:MiaB/RimO family radical SAM methylthiotransferase [Gordonibacter sp.]|uniref:MiaB/RimO family radical SAM methylthiotransferase n=1 Tax=Gordonibacter sp. TaxID=1968902 RepID=UPI002FC62881